MRLERLRLANLNALAGAWDVDCTAPEIAGEGVLLIAGPTGAGKTTVLDAITLALFGRTPRVGRITETHNEVLTRGEAEMLAEVVFSARGRRYQASFSQRRARGSPSGRLQAPRHELVDLDAGRVLATGLRDTEAAVAQALGLDFAQFTRAVLLAQNGFAAFLLAAPDERAPLLERITGTAVYSQLSVAAHLRAKEERERLEDLRRRLEAVAVESPEEMAAARQRLAELEAELAAVGARLGELRRLQQRWAEVRRWQEEVDAGATAEAEALRALAALEPERRAAAQARQAEEAAPLVAEVERLGRELQEADATLRRLAEETAQADAEAGRLSAAQTQAQERLQAAQAEEARLGPAVALARDLDARLLAAAALHRQAEAAVQEAARRLAEQEARQARARQERARLARQLEDLGLARTDAAAVAAARARWGAQEERAGRDLAAARAELDALQAELALVREMESLEAKRRALRPGAPCPLCGSRHHPFVQERPALRPVEAAVAAARARCQELQAEAEAARQALRELDTLWARLAPLLAAEEEAARAETEARAALAAAETRSAAARADLERLQSQRQAVLAGAAVEAVERRLQRAVAEAAQERERLQQRAAATAALLAGLQARAGEWQQRRASLVEALAGARARLAARLAELGFASVGVWQAVRRDPAWVAAVEERGRAAEARLAAVQHALQGARQRLHLARQAVAGALPEAEAAQAVAELEARQQTLQEERALVAARLSQWEQRQAEAQRLLQEAAAQAEAVRVWERLRELMGSADGKKLRVFAQGLTLDVLVALANGRLAAMSDRYQLARAGDGLDLAVVDGYRAGERRSVRNLSGGETFVVSLALALALSSLVSRGEPLGCLFVDEGFGALDEDSLELVLDSLLSLGQEDRLVGVISHVPALRERLACQLLVRPVAPGRSGLWVRRGEELVSLAVRRSGCGVDGCS